MATLREMLTGDPVTVGPDHTMADAAATMVQGRVGSVLVMVEGALEGILTERDVLRAAGADGDLLTTRVDDWMTQDPTTADAETDIAEALETMVTNGFRHLPVTDGGEVVGVVSLRGLLEEQVLGRSASTRGRAARTTTPAPEPTAATTPTADPAPTAVPEQVSYRRERMFEATRMLQQRSHASMDDPGTWRSELSDAVDEIEEVVAEHVAGTEGGDGFFEELVRESGGRLQPAVRRLRRDHERSTELVEELREAVDTEAEPETLQQRADELFAQLEAHRHRGSDLLWQAHGVEIGVGD